MTPAKKLWKEEEELPVEPKAQMKTQPVDSRLYAIVKLLIIIILYYVIVLM